MENTLILKNPLIFWNENFFKKMILIEEYSTGVINIIYQNEMPYEVLITFPSKQLCDKFLSQYNTKTFESINHPLTIEYFNSTITEESEKVLNSSEKRTPIPYYYKYEEFIFKDYENSLSEPGLIYKNEFEKDKIKRGVKWLLKKIGSNILAGQSVMNISLPVFLFDKRTLHEVLAYELRGAPYYLTQAFFAEGKFERLKWVTVYVIASFYVSTFQIKPFNPILGETFQCKIGDMNMYSEHTANHPLTANFYCFDDNHRYKIHGYLITIASTGTNSIYAYKIGKYKVTFSDGGEYEIYLPAVELRGLTFGNRLYNYVDRMVIVDRGNNLCTYIEMNPDQVSYIKSWFGGKQGSYPDTFRGGIFKLSEVEVNEKEPKHKLKEKFTKIIDIEGKWTKEVIFDGDEYWNIQDYKLLPITEVGYKLPSDGRNRPDLIALINNDEELSQKEKEKLEVLQRKDRKLRADWLKTQKK